MDIATQMTSYNYSLHMARTRRNHLRQAAFGAASLGVGTGLFAGRNGPVRATLIRTVFGTGIGAGAAVVITAVAQRSAHAAVAVAQNRTVRNIAAKLLKAYGVKVDPAVVAAAWRHSGEPFTVVTEVAESKETRTLTLRVDRAAEKAVLTERGREFAL